MRRTLKQLYLSLIILFSLAACGGGGSGIAPQETPPAAETPREQLYSQELDLIDSTLRDNHPDLFFSLSESDYVADLEQLRGRLDNIEDTEFRLESARIVASFKDQHTYLIIPENLLLQYPFEVWWTNDAAVIVKASSEYQEYLGYSITEIEGTPVAELKNVAMDYLAYENEHWKDALSPRFLKYAELLYYRGYTSSKEQALFALRSPGGEPVQLELESSYQIDWTEIESTHDNPPAYKSSNDNYHIMELDDVIYVQYNSALHSPLYSITALTDDILASMAQRPEAKLVFDLRFNHGGIIDHFVPVIEAVADTDWNRPDKLFVLTGRHTFSSGVGATYRFQELTQATFVGMPTGGKPNGFSHVAGLQLYSLNSLYLSTDYREITDPDVPTFEPDFYTPFTQLDFLTGRDPALAFITSHWQ